MAKRKRENTETPSKKAKPTKTKGKSLFDDLAEGFWPIKAIRGERINQKGEVQYLVEWASDPKTGEQYPFEWNSEVTDAAISEWAATKEKKYKLGDLEKGEEFVVPAQQSTDRPQRVKAKRVIVPSPSATTRSNNQTSQSTVSGNLALPPLSSASPRSSLAEVPESQAKEHQNRHSVRVVISPITESQERSSGQSLSQQSTISRVSTREASNQVEETPSSGLPEEHTPSSSVGPRVGEQVISNSTGNTVPDSQPARDSPSQQTSPNLVTDSIPQSEPQAPGELVVQSTHEISNLDEPISDGLQDRRLRSFASPATSSSVTQLFEEPRSAQEHSACSSVESDTEILSLSQGISTGQSQSQSQNHSLTGISGDPGPSAQPELVPSIEKDYIAESFQTQVPHSFTLTQSGSDQEQQASVRKSTSQAPVHTSKGPEAPRQPTTPKAQPIANKSQSQDFFGSTQEDPSSQTASADLSSIRAYLSSRQQPSLQSNSMARTSRESTPRSSRASPAISAVPGQSLQERLTNLRAPAKALAEARRQNNAARTAIPQLTGSELDTAGDKPSTAVDDTTESNIIQSTEKSTASDVDVYSQEDPPVAGSLAPAPMIIESGSTDNTSTEYRSQKLPMVPQLGPSEYVVALPVEGKMRDQYLEVMHLKENDTTKYLQADRKPSPALFNSMKSMIELLAMVTAHTDYIVEGQLTQSNVTPAQEATWAEYASTKFAFLGHLFEIIRAQSKTVLLVASSRRVRDGLATYCTGRKIAHTTLGDPSEPMSFEYISDSSLSVIISETYISRPQQQIPESDLIIVFDTSAVITNTPHESRSGTGPPLVHLVVKNSPEHAALCLPKDTPPSDVLYRIVRETTASRRVLGKIEIGTEAELAQYSDYNRRTQAMKRDFSIKIMMASKAIAHCLSEEDFDSAWPLPIVPFDLVDDFKYPSMPPVRSASPAVSRTGTPLGSKRTLDASDGSGTKRQRLTPLHDITHVTDSMEDAQSQVDRLKEDLRKVQQALAQERTERATEIETLHIALATAEGREKEMAMELRKIQYRYETRTREVHTMRRTISKHEEQKLSEADQRSKILADNERLRDQRKTLQSELNAARTALKEGGGTTGELEVAREQIRKLEKEKASLEKSNANMKKDFEFALQQYQNASTVAADNASQVTELETEIVALKTVASDEKRRLKETNFSTDRARYLSHIAQLEGEVASRDVILQRKEEELKTVKRGRGMQTRASSVQPGSPRLAGIGATPGSRGTSPVPGFLSVGRMSALRHER